MRSSPSSSDSAALANPMLPATDLPGMLRAAIERIAYLLTPGSADDDARPPAREELYDLQRTIDEMRQALDEQMQLLLMVIHDIRTPLTTIQGYADMLQHGVYGPLSDEQVRVLDRVIAASAFLHRLADGLLEALPGAERVQQIGQQQEFDPAALVRDIAADCYPQAAGRGLELRVNCPDGLPRIVGSPDRLRAVLYNLLGNALRYTARGSVTLSVVQVDDAIEFQVEDTGPGIPLELQEVIWQPFVRAQDAERGIGLGLFIVHRLTHDMGGVVGVRSVVGVGSTFWLRLPQHQAEKAVGEGAPPS